MSLYFKPKPFKDEDRLIELKEIEIEEIEGGCCDSINLILKDIGRINVFNIDDIQEEIEELWNNGSEFLRGLRNE